MRNGRRRTCCRVRADARYTRRRRRAAERSADVLLSCRARCGGDGQHADAGHLRLLSRAPLPPGQVSDFVPFSLCALGETPVPTLGAADRVRVEAVIDDADAHGTYPPSLMGVTAVRTRDELSVHVSVVIPCLNEAETIAECVTSARGCPRGERPSGGGGGRRQRVDRRQRKLAGRPGRRRPRVTPRVWQRVSCRAARGPRGLRRHGGRRWDVRLPCAPGSSCGARTPAPTSCRAPAAGHPARRDAVAQLDRQSGAVRVSERSVRTYVAMRTAGCAVVARAPPPPRSAGQGWSPHPIW